MSVAEHLYTQGYISYPRTETTQYPSAFDFNSVLRFVQYLLNTFVKIHSSQQSGSQSEYSKYASELLRTGYSHPRKGDDKGDHPPITPMRADDGHLSGMA